MTIGRFTMRRIGVGTLQIVMLLALVFALSLWLPGDAADVQSGDFSSAAQREETRRLLGLDVAPLQRFLEWCAHAATGDFGTSFTQSRPVTDVIAEPFVTSAVLAVLTTLFLIPVAGVAGFVAGLHPDTWWDRTITTVSIVADSVPDYVLAVVLVSYLAVEAGWFPATFAGMDSADVAATPSVLILPLFVMICRVAAPLVRLVRAGVIDEMSAPYVVQARRLGVSRWSLLLRHVAPNALGPAMQDLGRTGDSLLSGVLIVEAVFVVPGIATTLIDGIGNRDQPVVLAIVLITGLVAIVVNAAIDIAGQRMVPARVRT
ncbi:ABC transporter permease [Gordonia insulae]|uniref:Glutathione transport system permease protein GsiC n=1 Tax=Gordonia insulae TaxID=2420509 RepID=A0A3G8JSF8_9ACTN|nr:ABC transporter permease [Gordonia insulae]AZG48074.1 Glutathione transport system permease protein GsiC [Gordonia insulae]